MSHWENIHIDEKPYRCITGKTLKTHWENMHTGEKPYSCQKCEKMYTHTHTRTHTHMHSCTYLCI